VASFDEVVPPGQAGKITARMNTGHGRGAQSKTVTVTSNDPVEPVTPLTFRAYVEGSVVFVPGEAITIVSRGEARRPGRVIVRKDPTEKGDLKVTDLTSSAAWLSPTARRVDSSQDAADGLPAASPGDWIITATLSADAPTGNHRETVRFATGLPREPQIELPVTVFIPADITISPNPLELRTTGLSVSGSAIVVVRGGIDRSGMTVKAEPGDFSATLEPSGATSARVQVAWVPDGPTGATAGQVTVQVGDHSAVLPVRVLIAKPAAATKTP